MTLTPAQAERNRALQAGRDRRKRERLRAEKMAARRQATATRAHASDPRVIAFREEKARKAKADANVIASAKREYDAMLEKQALARKGGRPASKARGYRLDLTRDPADALVDALQRKR